MGRSSCYVVSLSRPGKYNPDCERVDIQGVFEYSADAYQEAHNIAVDYGYLHARSVHDMTTFICDNGVSVVIEERPFYAKGS